MKTAADKWRSRGLGLWACLALLYLFIPIFVVALFSFNDPQGRFNLDWQGFTLDHWLHPFAAEGISTAVRNSSVSSGVKFASRPCLVCCHTPSSGFASGV